MLRATSKRTSDEGPQQLLKMESLIDMSVLHGEDSEKFGQTCQAIAEIVSSKLYKYAADTKCLNTYFKNKFDLYRHQVLKYVEFAQVFDTLQDFEKVPTNWTVVRQFCKLSNYPSDWKTLWQQVLSCKQPVTKDLVQVCWNDVLKQKELEGATQLLGMSSRSQQQFESVIAAEEPPKSEHFYDNEALRKDMDFILLSLRRLKAHGVVMEVLTPSQQWVGHIQDIRFVPDSTKVAIPKLPIP